MVARFSSFFAAGITPVCFTYRRDTGRCTAVQCAGNGIAGKSYKQLRAATVPAPHCRLLDDQASCSKWGAALAPPSDRCVAPY